MLSIHLSLGNRSYPIFIGKNLLSQAGNLIHSKLPSMRQAVIVTQKEISVYYQKPLLDSLSGAGIESIVFLPPFSKSSEAAKSHQVFWKLIKKMASCDGKGKSLCVVALGGGVVGDLAGFAASVYRRGVPIIQIPTTLTAQVDSAIGGKNAIDLPEGKNLLGTIYQPQLVLSDVDILSSLSQRHWSDGFAEVIKYGVIKDPSLFVLLEKSGSDGMRKNPKLLERVIYRCAKIKAKIVELDELDKRGIRMALNFGHTAGHAIEAAGGFSGQYTHGEAVGIGMLIACDISYELGLLKDIKLRERLEKTLIKFNLPLYYRGLSPDLILKAMGYDKKSESGTLRFVLPVSLGKTMIYNDVPTPVIVLALQKRKA